MAPSTRSPSQPTVDATRARQGWVSGRVIWVLAAALVLVILGFLATWGWHARDLSSVQNNAQAPQSAAQSYKAPQPAAASRQNYRTGGPLAPQNQGNPGQPNQSNTTTP